MDLNIVKEFQQRLKGACESSVSVTVDLRDVNFIDSPIESRLAQACVALNGKGKRLKVIVIHGSQPEKSLRLIGLPTLADIEEHSSM